MSNIINFNFRPKLNGYSTEEPSLRSLIYKYYAEHFTAEESEAFTEQYMNHFKQEN